MPKGSNQKFKLYRLAQIMQEQTDEEHYITMPEIMKEAGYIKNKGLDDQYYKTLIIEYLKQYSKANRKEINKLLWDKLPDSLSDDQKKHKVHNLLTALKNKYIIEKDGENQRKANWILKD